MAVRMIICVFFAECDAGDRYTGAGWCSVCASALVALCWEPWNFHLHQHLDWAGKRLVQCIECRSSWWSSVLC